MYVLFECRDFVYLLCGQQVSKLRARRSQIIITQTRQTTVPPSRAGKHTSLMGLCKQSLMSCSIHLSIHFSASA